MSVNNDIQSFKEYTKNICYKWVEISKIRDEINSQNLIEMLQELQCIHNTTDLKISSEVIDGYLSSTQIVISRIENADEYNERIRGMYNYYVARENNARKKEQYEKQLELDKLMRKQQELQKQIDALK